jgi:hypothetical protein
MTTRRLAIALAVVGALAPACIHKRRAHLEPDGIGSGSGSGAGSGSGSAFEVVEHELVQRWKVATHVRGAAAALDDHDASALDGRLLEITAKGYTSPWHGTCEAATLTRGSRPLAAVAQDHELDAAALAHLGFGDPLTELHYDCTDALQARPLVLYLTADKLLTCFQGVCFLMLPVNR